MARSANDSSGLYGHTALLPRTGGAEVRNQNQNLGLGRDGQRKKRRTKGRITIASLNMRGGGGGGANEKWMRINQLLRDRKLAVVALQETHLATEKMEDLNELFKASMVILGSPDDQNPTGARGVGFAINTRIVALEDMEMKVVVPGRAALLRFRWTGDRVLSVLNVYAPNVDAENALFWDTVAGSLAGMRGRNPELILGDFNMVEDSMDRLPPRCDQAAEVESLGKLVGTLRLVDGWRVNNPNTRAYTYLQAATSSQSRIDRIYASSELMQRAEDWEIMGSGILTDHRVVSVSLANYKAPGTGRGRWAMPQVLLTDGEFVKTMRKMGCDLQMEMEAIAERSALRNPQRLYQAFKDKLRLEARARAKRLLPKIDRKIEALQHDIATLLEGCDPDKHRVAILQDRMMKLEVKRFERKRRAVATKDWMMGETVSRYWAKLNAPQLPSTVIFEMRVRTEQDGRRVYTSSSAEMANTAKTHYDGLQTDVLPPDFNHGDAIETALEPLEAKLSPGQKGVLAKRMKRLEIIEAVSESPLGKAPGLDGLPAEVWKTYLKWEQSDESAGRETFRISHVLKSVFNDIEIHGVDPETSFADGWICPIYKLKKDQREVVNYRPITLLNSDYKIMTRALAMRLSVVADSLILHDQAAFIPGRQIFTHIKLSRMILEYAEAEESNGAIVALDQEKAYDMINHEYLWATLRRMNFPENFIRTVMHLYARAKSCVMVNGTQSDFYQIIRGVRQGDPMSCLLFVLAIEPLACGLRKSSLRGMQVKGDPERLIAALFADDTTVYLDESDDYADLQNILERWCAGARARFNHEKTDVLPVGTVQFRTDMAERRATSMLSRTIPASVRIVKDGELIRSLGAWIGNNCDEDVPWIRMIQVLERNLTFWSRRNPTLNGRKLIVGMEIGGRSQFLAKAQPMSSKIERRLESMVGTFMANGEKRPRIGRDTLYKPIEKGGLKVLDICARNEAIDTMWLKEYLRDAPGRPRWAIVADAIRSTVAAARNVEDSAKMNAFIQTWRVSMHHKAGLGEDLRRMVKVATKYNLEVSVRNPSEEFKTAMPVWYHIGEAVGRSLANTLSAKCLRERHGVATVGECAAVAARLQRNCVGTPGRHATRRTCQCYDCERDRTVNGCDDPHRCACMAAKMVEKLAPLWKLNPDVGRDTLSLTPGRLQRNANARVSDERVTFNPTVKSRPPVSNALRMFASTLTDQHGTRPARRRVGERMGDEVEVYTDGSCRENGMASAIAACGVWFGENDERNLSTRLPGPMQSNQAAEVYAIEAAVGQAPCAVPLHIVSDSRFAVDGLTVHLPQWEDRNWLGVKCAPLFKRAVARLRMRTAPTTLRWVKGHAGLIGNERADTLAKAGLDKPDLQLPPLERVVGSFLHEGVRVCVITQRLAYLAIRMQKEIEQRRASSIMVGRAQAAMLADCGAALPEERIWMGLRDKDVPRKIRDFLWKMLHGAQRVGEYWSHIPGYEIRATCGVCGVEDSMEHILFECTAPGQDIVWKMVRGAIQMTGCTAPSLSIGMVVAAPGIIVKRPHGERARGPSRLAKILITEAAHLVWRLRCQRISKTAHFMQCHAMECSIYIHRDAH